MSNDQQLTEAYSTLGLPAHASLLEVEQRYHILVRQMRTLELEQSTTLHDEARLRAATRAYRFILDWEKQRLTEAYRQKHYNRFQRLSRFVEELDNLFSHYQAQIVLSIMLIFVIGTLSIGTAIVHRHAPVFTSAEQTDFTILVAGDMSYNEAASSLQALDEQCKQQWSDAAQVALLIGPVRDQDRELMLYTEKADLYLLDQANFSKLLTLGYLQKLDEWDTYGVDISQSELSHLFPDQQPPFIAAIGVNAPHRDRALAFIQLFHKE